jgi:cobalt/nickel transport system ATP-binding protein
LKIDPPLMVEAELVGVHPPVGVSSNLQSSIPNLQIRNLTHRYADGRTALADVSFDLQPGERVALVGPNGAGKTTLFLRLCGVLTGKPGEVTVNRLDPANATDRKQLPRHIGVVFQNPDDQLFSATVLEDVAFGPLNLGATADEAKRQASEALAEVGLNQFEERSPHKLSGGEKRRAALAGVLAMKPGVLLLDEPSMFLDPRGRRELIRTVCDLPGTLLLATHDLEMVLDCCPRVIVLDGGRVMADGVTSELLGNEQLMTTHGLEVPYRLT